jgi:hypothetical protein
MKRFPWLPIGALIAAASAGCVERHFIVETDQPGAVVLVNGQQLGGQSPVDGTFVYYGKYRFTLIKDGFQTQQVVQDIQPPWYQYPGIDFFSENVWPFMIRDTRRFYYQMSPLQTPNIDDTSGRALQLRNRAKTIGPTEPPPGEPAPPIPPGPPAPPPIPNP